jgi:uncharacterized damage-inducible protein DinB
MTVPGMVPPVADERQALLTYLAQQRYVLRLTAYGLTDEQARRASPVGTLTVGGLIKHVAETEWSWIDIVLQRDAKPSPEDYPDTFRLGPAETLDGVLRRYEEVAARTEAVVAGIDDLGRAVPVPHDVPWFPPHLEAWSVRWVLLHLVEETARHAGHADIVRESVDGATAFPLMAAAEGWAPTAWIQPWRPPGET